MNFLNLGAAVVAVMFLNAPSSLLTSQEAQSNATLTAIESYAAGRFDEAIDQLVAGSNLAALMRRFREDAEAWIAAADGPTRADRVGVVGSITIDLVGRGVERGADGGFPFPVYVEALRPLVEWMCARFRNGPQTPLERMFHLAATALLQASDSSDLLIGRRYAGNPVVPQAHILHGAERFPEESRFKLAWVLMRYETLLIGSDPLPPRYLLSNGAGRFEVDANAIRELADTIGVLTKLADDPAVGEEARLRRGVLRFLMDEPASATTDLQPLTTSADPFIKYIAHMILGAARTRAEDLPGAEGHYRAAFATVRATSAGTMLATTLFRLGRTTEAAEVLTQSDGLPSDQDPWRQYGMRDYRLFPQYLAQMRAMIVR